MVSLLPANQRKLLGYPKAEMCASESAQHIGHEESTAHCKQLESMFRQLQLGKFKDINIAYQ